MEGEEDTTLIGRRVSSRLGVLPKMTLSWATDGTLRYI